MNLTEQQTRTGYDTVRWQDAPGFESYWQDVQTARETGHAYDRNLFRGLEIVATLACDAEGTPRIGMSSITIAGQQGADSLAAVASSLKTAAEQIERGVFGRKTEA
jgi:DNA-binding IclR family transcriptional regulator